MSKGVKVGRMTLFSFFFYFMNNMQLCNFVSGWGVTYTYLPMPMVVTHLNKQASF